MNNKTLKSYEKLVKKINDTNLITEKEVNRIKNALSRDYETVSNILRKNNFKFSYNLTNDQKEKGKEYLVKKHLKLNGQQRLTSDLETGFIKMIQSLQEGYNYNFTFEGFEEITNGFFLYYAPVYKLSVNGYEIYYFHYNGNDYEEGITNYIDTRYKCISCNLFNII